MTTRTIRLEREYDLPRAIVWDALIDEQLVSGWLGEARIDPVLGGDYHLDWVGSPEIAPAAGRIVSLSESEHLGVATDAHGTLAFDLSDLVGGSRGSSTLVELTVVVAVERAFVAKIESDWEVRLDQLAELLRGHPVDWARLGQSDRASSGIAPVTTPMTTPAIPLGNPARGVARDTDLA